MQHNTNTLFFTSRLAFPFICKRAIKEKLLVVNERDLHDNGVVHNKKCYPQVYKGVVF